MNRVIESGRHYDNWTVNDCEDFMAGFRFRGNAERHGWGSTWDHAFVVSFQDRMTDPWAEEIL